MVRFLVGPFTKLPEVPRPRSSLSRLSICSLIAAARSRWTRCGSRFDLHLWTRQCVRAKWSVGHQTPDANRPKLASLLNGGMPIWPQMAAARRHERLEFAPAISSIKSSTDTRETGDRRKPGDHPTRNLQEPIGLGINCAS